MASGPTAPPMEAVKDETQAKKDDKDGGDDNEKSNDSMFECNICLDTAKDAVVRYIVCSDTLSTSCVQEQHFICANIRENM